MPGQFYSPEGDLEEHFITNHWLIDQYIGDTLWTCGQNSTGDLGNYDNIGRSTAVQEFTSSTNWVQVGVGYKYTAAIKSDGSLWTWGRNSYGSLGINLSGLSSSRSTPVREFTSSSNWKYVSCGIGHVAAIKTDGTLWLWGNNTYGQLATNDNVSRFTPVQEWTSSTNWKFVSASSGTSSIAGHTAAIKTDGTLWSWGYNSNGQLGSFDIISRSTPIQEFISSTNWKFVYTSIRGTLILDTSNILWGCGENSGYTIREAALGGNVSISTPSLTFSSPYTWKTVSIGAGSMATGVKLDGTLWRWGLNPTSNGGGTYKLLSQEQTFSNNWKQVSTSQYGWMAIKTDGTLWAVGAHVYGAFMLNTTVFSSTPRQEFTSSTNWKQISCTQATVGSVAAIRTGIEMDTGNLT